MNHFNKILAMIDDLKTEVLKLKHEYDRATYPDITIPTIPPHTPYPDPLPRCSVCGIAFDPNTSIGFVCSNSGCPIFPRITC